MAIHGEYNLEELLAVSGESNPRSDIPFLVVGLRSLQCRRLTRERKLAL